MCYSAQIQADYAKYVREFGADIDIDEFVRLYWDREGQPKLRIPKAMDASFSAPETEQARRIAAMIARFDGEQTTRFEQDVFKQKKRLADAERVLQTKTTKKALEDQRVSKNKIEYALGKLNDLRRTRLEPRDSRIFPSWYAPVMISEQGRRMVRPMRYQCRPAHVSAQFDIDRPNAYNARRDSLEGFWKRQFGYTHGILMIDAFYENVSRHAMEGRELAPGETEENVILEFRPRSGQPMLVACLWSRWQGAGQPDLLSFAAITDDPPPEIAAAGHDRVIIPIKPEHVDAWLNPDPGDLKTQYAILDDRERPYYEHRMAA
ncbi:SOS response-associated peptidase family protein [Arenimonas oryziterrae]|uniref:Abasic site processing protein n=1 Tax=Arenimonas oryziterrae DSM 21050 = YC6267 TaxID=1121015 RepID=A0A091AYR4_9GAMM|nr:SOS response-associated peptidase family protein [Arenimonas oryziterrae]KFN44422.1 hypothetical protein N789_00005 [Arenimonas oryziterrae DSM 21050 = YC6267]